MATGIRQAGYVAYAGEAFRAGKSAFTAAPSDPLGLQSMAVDRAQIDVVTRQSPDSDAGPWHPDKLNGYTDSTRHTQNRTSSDIGATGGLNLTYHQAPAVW